MIQIDRHSVIQVLGALMTKPEIFNDTDKYLLEVSDFSKPLDKFVFSAIYNLYLNGAEKIHAMDIENYLKSNSYAIDLIEKENGRAFLQDCESYGEVENFNYYYNKLKKTSFLRDIQKTGRSIEQFYCEDITDEKYQEINDKFEKLSVNDILNSLRSEVAGFENKYVLNNIVEEGKPADSIRERVLEWKQKPEVGCHLQGAIFNTITRGGRKGKIYLRSSNSGGGKSRTMVGDACYIAYPVRYDRSKCKWVETGPCEKVLYIMTEQEKEEIDSMILAYLTGYNEDVFTYATFDPNDPIVEAAIQIMEQYADNFMYSKVADPCSSVIKNLFRRYNLQYGVENFFYDYIFSSPAMLNEYRDLKIREDVALRLFTTTLKNLAVELNSFILTSTQLSNMDDDNGGFKDYRNIQGSRAIVNLVDFACIMTKPTKQDLLAFGEFSSNYNCTPNVVIDIFKNRRGRWNNVRIWGVNDLGSCRREDLCVTTSTMKIIEDFTIYNFTELNEDKKTNEMLDFYNEGIVGDIVYEDIITPQIEKPAITRQDIEDAFHNKKDNKKRYENKGMADLL